MITRERVWWSYTFVQNLLHVLYKCRVIHVSFLMYMYGVLAHTLIEFGFLLLYVLTVAPLVPHRACSEAHLWCLF